MNTEQLADEVIVFLRHLHEDYGWNPGLEALCCCIAEVEAMERNYPEKQVVRLASTLWTAIHLERDAGKAAFN